VPPYGLQRHGLHNYWPDYYRLRSGTGSEKTSRIRDTGYRNSVDPEVGWRQHWRQTEDFKTPQCRNRWEWFEFGGPVSPV